MECFYENRIQYSVSEDVDNSDNLWYDPIGQHMLKLRLYLSNAEESLQKVTEMKRLKKTSDELKPLEDPPPFPDNYPFKDAFQPSQDRSRVIKKVSRDGLGESEKKAIYTFVNNVVLQVGYESIGVDNRMTDTMDIDDDDDDIEDVDIKDVDIKDVDIKDVLYECTVQFIQKLMKMMYHYKSDTNGDLLALLNKCLDLIGYGGLLGLHNFYYMNIVKKHDILYEKYISVHDKYETLCKELCKKK